MAAPSDVQSFARLHHGAGLGLIGTPAIGSLLQTMATGETEMRKDNGRRLGWVGAGRMGQALAGRLLAAGHDVAVYNRTRAKAESLAEAGATVVDSPADLADRDVVFTMVAGPDDFQAVVLGDDGLLSRDGAAPSVIVDLTTVSPEASAAVRSRAERRRASSCSPKTPTSTTASRSARSLPQEVDVPRIPYFPVERLEDPVLRGYL